MPICPNDSCLLKQAKQMVYLQKFRIKVFSQKNKLFQTSLNILFSFKFKAIKTENGNLTQSIVSPTNSSGESSKFGQFGLFFRKVYNLASLRLRDLCVRLKINAEDIQLKIWTLLENALNSHTILICDHHLDQIIMCSIFVICKINLDPDHAIFFEDIIKYYRLQPQAVSKVSFFLYYFKTIFLIISVIILGLS